jgi:hypothetical protein
VLLVIFGRNSNCEIEIMKRYRADKKIIKANFIIDGFLSAYFPPKK